MKKIQYNEKYDTYDLYYNKDDKSKDYYITVSNIGYYSIDYVNLHDSDCGDLDKYNKEVYEIKYAYCLMNVRYILNLNK